MRAIRHSQPCNGRGRLKRPAALFFALVFTVTSSLTVSPAELFAAPVVEAPVASPDHLLPNTPAALLVTCRIIRSQGDPAVVSNGVYLYKVDGAGKVIATIATMHDDGLNGDAAAGDDIYSAQVRIGALNGASPLYLQVSVPFQRVVRRTLSPVTTVPVTSDNKPPVFTSSPETTAPDSLTYFYTPAASDPEGGAVTFSLKTAPAGMTLTNGVVKWTPGKDQIGDQDVVIRASDPGNAFTDQSFKIKVFAFNLNPSITSVPALVAKTSDKYAYDVKAFDPEGQPVHFDFTVPPPAGMTLDSQTGHLEWTPGAGDTGPHEIAVRAADPLGAEDVQTYSLAVYDRNAKLNLISPAGSYNIEAGKTLTLDLKANLARTVFSADEVPVNAVLTQQSFRFTPAADQVGTHLVVFRAKAAGQEVSNPVEIHVVRPNAAPVFTQVSPQTVKEGETLSLVLSAADADGDPLTFSAPGLSLANAFFNQLTHQFIFTPSFQQSGAYDVAFEVTDGLAKAQTSVPITVQDAPPVTQLLDLTVDDLPNPTFKSALSIRGSVTGQPGTPAEPERPVVITGVSPSSVKQGETRTIDLTGLNTHFTQGASTANFGDGITVTKLEVTSPTVAKATVSADAQAAAGTRQIRVATEGEEALSITLFSVEPGASSVKGRIVDTFTKQALKGARIGINGTNLSVLSANDGTFTLQNVPPGTHTLLVTLANYTVGQADVTAGLNEQVQLTQDIELRALAVPASPGGTLPAAPSVASVLDRGVTKKGGGLTLEQARAVVTDTLIAVGGTEAGVLDDAGNQLNPKIQGAGDVSLTQEGVERQAKSLMLGDVVTLREFYNVLHGAFNFPVGLALGDLVTGFQQAVDEAWANPADPGSGMAIVLFNEGTSLSPVPPVVSPDTRFNRFQAFLLFASFLTANKASIEDSINKILEANGIDYNAMLPPPKFPPAGGNSGDGGLFAYAKMADDWLVPSVMAQTPPDVPSDCFQSLACQLAQNQKKQTFSKVWRAIGANLIAESAKSALQAAALAFLQQSAISYMMGTTGGRLGAAAGVLNLAAAATQGAVSVIFFKLVMGWVIANTAASFEPAPPAGRGSFVNPQGNFVISFDPDPEEVRLARNPPAGQLKRDFTYHLYRVPDCGAAVDAARAEHISLAAEIDFSDSANRQPPYVGARRFVVPASMLAEGKNHFRIRAFQYIHNRDQDLIEGLEPYDLDGSGTLSLDEFIRGGKGADMSFYEADLDFNGSLDASEFAKFSLQRIPTEFEILNGVPANPGIRSLLGHPDLQPGTQPGSYKAELAARQQELAQRAAGRVDAFSKGYKARTNIVDFFSNSPFSRGNAEYLPQIQDFVNNRKAFLFADDAIRSVEFSKQQILLDGDQAVTNQVSENVYQKNFGVSPNAQQKASFAELVKATRIKAATATQAQFAAAATDNVESTISNIESGRLTQGKIILTLPTFPNPETTEVGGITFTYDLTPANKDAVLTDIKNPVGPRGKAFVARLQSTINAVKANNKFLDAQAPILKDGLKITGNFTDAEVESRFQAFLPKQTGVGIRGQAIAKMADGSEQELRTLIQQMKQRQAGPLTISEPELDPSVVGFQKGVGAFTNFAGQVVGGSSALLAFLQSVQVLSSEFSESCFETTAPAAPVPTEPFPPSFEPYPGADQPGAVLRDLKTGPKQGFLQREYPGSSENVSAVDAGFPPGFVSIDRKGRAYAVNMASTQQFGGRIFRFTLRPEDGGAGNARGFTASRELAGAVTYFSLLVQIARPATPVAMTLGPAFAAADGAGRQVQTQDLFVANIDVVDGKKQILDVPVSLLDTNPSAYPESNRNHLVGQPVIESDELRLTGPSDMEAGPDPASLTPVENANSVIMLSDEENIFAILRDPVSHAYALKKAVSLAGRRWSGLAFDRMGRLYFADYAKGEIYVMPWENLRDILLGTTVPVAAESELVSRAYRIASGLSQPGDLELEPLSTHPGGVLDISTFKGIVPLTLPIVGPLGDASDVRVSLLGIEQSAKIDAERHTFIATPSRDNLETMQATLRAKHVDADGRTTWVERNVLLAENGVTILKETL